MRYEKYEVKEKETEEYDFFYDFKLYFCIFVYILISYIYVFSFLYVQAICENEDYKSMQKLYLSGQFAFSR